jgi:hypothetical protein
VALPASGSQNGPSRALALQGDIWHTGVVYFQRAGRGRLDLCGLTSVLLTVRADAQMAAGGLVYPTVSLSPWNSDGTPVSLSPYLPAAAGGGVGGQWVDVKVPLRALVGAGTGATHSWDAFSADRLAIGNVSQTCGDRLAPGAALAPACGSLQVARIVFFRDEALVAADAATLPASSASPLVYVHLWVHPAVLLLLLGVRCVACNDLLWVVGVEEDVSDLWLVVHKGCSRCAVWAAQAVGLCPFAQQFLLV